MERCEKSEPNTEKTAQNRCYYSQKIGFPPEITQNRGIVGCHDNGHVTVINYHINMMISRIFAGIGPFPNA